MNCHSESGKFRGLKSLLGVLSVFVSTGNASALEIDWSGQFWSEFNYIHNYAMDNSPQGGSPDAARLNATGGSAGGYYVSGSGNQDAGFQSLFLRVRPKVIVNDNIFVKSEWWVGDPIFSIFGGSLPYSPDQRQYYSSQSRGSFIMAQRLWGEFMSDIGTFQVGRVPLDWGVGVIWNSGEAMWSRYMSTGDAIRWIGKFGSFSFIPSVIVNSAGNNIAGSCTLAGGVCTPGTGSGGVVDYSIILKYENTEDELEGGINVIRRYGGWGQEGAGGVLTPPQPTVGTPYAGTMNFTTFDFFARKKFSRLTLSGEVPLVTGSVGASNYQTYAIAAEADWKVSDVWQLQLKTGYAPGQSNQDSASIDTYRAFFFHPNYHIGMIMFNYQLANFGGAQTQNNPSMSGTALRSPYDNPIVDAAYVSFTTHFRPWDKWTFRPGVVYAVAPTAATSGKFFYNNWTKTMQNNTTGADQGTNLGWEVDLGVTFQWDEMFQFAVDTGVFLPGSFYAFSNTATANPQSAVFATSVRVGVSF